MWGTQPRWETDQSPTPWRRKGNKTLSGPSHFWCFLFEPAKLPLSSWVGVPLVPRAEAAVKKEAASWGGASLRADPSLVPLYLFVWNQGPTVTHLQSQRCLVCCLLTVDLFQLPERSPSCVGALASELCKQSLSTWVSKTNGQGTGSTRSPVGWGHSDGDTGVGAAAGGLSGFYWLIRHILTSVPGTLRAPMCIFF